MFTLCPFRLKRVKKGKCSHESNYEENDNDNSTIAEMPVVDDSQCMGFANYISSLITKPNKEDSNGGQEV